MPDDNPDQADIDRARRAAAVAHADHSTRLEGGKVSDYARALSDCWVEGLITDEDELRLLKKHYTVG